MSALIDTSGALALPAKPSRLIAVEPKLVLPSLASDRYLVDIDFSLAIHNRTGKYFIGKELLAMSDLPVGDVYYWRFARAEPPQGVIGKIVGRLQHLQIVGRTTGGPLGLLPRRRSRRPILHLDPFTVPSTELRRKDAVLIHDLGPISHPELFTPAISKAYQRIYEEIAAIGPHLVFVSAASETEFNRLFPGVAATSRRIIHPPIRPAIYNVRQNRPPIDLPDRFLLTVGSIGRRKNQLTSIAGYARSGLAERGVAYVICGGPEPYFAEVEAEAKRTPGVILLQYVPDEELSWLYANASGFVLMSLLEGFGMPVSEAVSQGLIPLVSQQSALTEVAGQAALQADPTDADDIALKMCHLADLSDVERADRLRRLRASIERFDLQHFRQAWRLAFNDIIASC
jgi:glycosyltransferase involved in cell wall biosynthesis